MLLNEIPVDEVYEKDDKLKREDVTALIKWMEKQPHLPKVSELQLALFLHSCYYSNEAAKHTIDTYYTVKTLCRDILGSEDVTADEDLQATLKAILICPLPKNTATGELIIFCKIMDASTNNYILRPQVNLLDMVLLLHLHQYGPSEATHIVVDMQGLGFEHFLKFNPIIMKKFGFYAQHAIPVRLKSLHFFNTVPFVEKVAALLKPLMKKEILESFQLHSHPDSLFKTFPKEMFPRDYGGSCESLQVLQERMRRQVLDNKQFIKFLTSQVVDESKRQGKPTNASDFFGVDGSFKKLEVD